MAQAKAKLSYLRIAPRKVRLIADMLRRKTVKDAQAILSFTIKKGSVPIMKLLKSAMANAENNFKMDPDNLYISKISVDEGAKLKRFMPRARGSASPIQKKTSNILIVLDEIVPGKKAANKKKEVEENKIEAANNGKKPKYEPEKKKEIPRNEARGLKKVFHRRKSV